MGDRRPFSFRFWQSGGSSPNRRSSAPQTTTTRTTPQTTAPPQATTTPAAVPPSQTTAARQAPRTTSSPLATTTSAATPPPQTTTTRPAPRTTDSPPVTTTLAATPPPQSTTSSPLATNTSAATPPPPTVETQSAGQSTSTIIIPPSTTPPAVVTETSASRPDTTPSATPAPPSTITTTTPLAPAPNPPTAIIPATTPNTTTSSAPLAPTPKGDPTKSPSRAAPQARSKPTSPSQSPPTPQRASQLRSSTRLATRSPRQTSSRIAKAIQSLSPSKESTQDKSNSNKVPTSDTDEKDSKPETSQQEPKMKADDQTVDDERKIRENLVELKSPQLSADSKTTSPAQDPTKPSPPQKLVSSAINGEDKPLDKSNKNSEETKEVKEVTQATDTKANEQIKKKGDYPLPPTSGSKEETIQAADLPSKPDQNQMKKREAFDTKEFSASLPHDSKPSNARISKTRNTSTSSNTHVQSALPSGGHVPLSKDFRDDISKIINRANTGDPKSMQDRSVSVITLSGENRGASMQIGSNASKREGPVHINRGYKLKHARSTEATIDGVESSEGNKSEDARNADDHQTESYINNNVQGINNSIVFNSSVAKRDPGVHMVITQVPIEPTESTDRRTLHETRKAKFKTTPADNVTYKPRVRSRYVRQLYLEASDVDPENPEMP